MFEFVKWRRTCFRFSTLSTEFSTQLSPGFRFSAKSRQEKEGANLCEIFCKFVAFPTNQRYNIPSERILSGRVPPILSNAVRAIRRAPSEMGPRVVLP